MIDLGWLIGNIIGWLLILATLVVLIIVSATNRATYEYEGLGPKGLWIAGTIVALLAQVGLNVWWNFPFDMAYHSYRPVSGTVADVNKRQVANGKSFEEKFAVRFEGSDQIYGCNDTRCSLAKKGDHIRLMCERTWQYASVSGYDCRYNQ